MSTTLSDNDQLKFALSCFRNCDLGKIDWKTVASECGIVTTGAAQKRWERLNKAHGVSASGSGGAGGGSDPSTPKPKEKGKGKKAATSATASKKRKLVKNEGEDDEVSE